MHAGSQMRPRKVRMRCGIKRGKKHVRVSWGLFQRRSNVYWRTHTRFTVSVGIDHSLTKTRRTRSADCICMDKRARI